MRIFNQFYTHIILLRSYLRFITNFIRLSPTLTKLYHIKRDYLGHIICSKCPRTRSDVCKSRR